MPPRSPSPRPPASAASAPASPAPASRVRSCRSSFVQLPRVEGALHQLQDVFLARGRLVVLTGLRILAELERDCELSPGYLVESVAQHRGILRILGQLQVERGRLGERQRQRVTRELRGMRLGEGLPDRDRTLLDCREDRAPPGLLELLELDRNRRRRRLERVRDERRLFALR